MLYSNLYETLKKIFNQDEDQISVPGSNIKVLNLPFSSQSADILPGSKNHRCNRHNRAFKDDYDSIKNDVQNTKYPLSLQNADCDFQINNRFRYTVFMPADVEISNGIILLFHGLNERHWDKYLPWAYRLVELTGKAVVLFPIAFHMNRAPSEWGTPKLMYTVSELRKKRHSSIAGSSFANAAISARIQTAPQRFFWSGRQTYSDILQLTQDIKKGDIPCFSKDSTIDFFAYSIGSFLSEILIMTNPGDWFSESRLFIFCGGPTLDRMYPVSKFILDSEANIALYSFFIEHLDNECRLNKRLNHYFNEDHRSGIYFRAMLSLHRHREIREERLRKIGNKIRAIALRKDEVIPPGEVLNTLKGDFRELPAIIDVMDFPYDYTHMTPFPINATALNEVNEAFDKVFRMAADHLS